MFISGETQKSPDECKCHHERDLHRDQAGACTHVRSVSDDNDGVYFDEFPCGCEKFDPRWCEHGTDLCGRPCVICVSEAGAKR